MVGVHVSNVERTCMGYPVLENWHHLIKLAAIESPHLDRCQPAALALPPLPLGSGPPAAFCLAARQVALSGLMGCNFDKVDECIY